MDNKTKGIIAALVIMIVAVIAFLCYTYAKDFIGEKNTNTVQVINETSNVVENTVVNEVENTVTETEEEEETKELPEDKLEEEPDDNSEVQDVDYEQKAINIVKNDIGNTEGLSFQVEDKGNGSYEVGVRDENSRTLAWYTVYPKTGKFTK